MTKLSLYACLLLCLAGPWPGAGTAAAQDPPGQAACAACIAMTILPGQVLLLPDDLQGLVVLIRAPDVMTQDLTAGIAAVRQRRGKPAIFVSAGTAGSDSVLALKIRLSDWRGLLPPDVLIAVEPPSGSSDLSGVIAPYADVIVSRSATPAPGHRVWRMLGSVDLAAALDASRGADVEGWVVELPRDALDAMSMMASFARAAAPAPDAMVEQVEVRAGIPLSADEIVARHQAVARRQAARINTAISTGTLTLTFEAPGFSAPVTVASETVIYQGAGRTELEQRRIRVNGLAFEGAGVPRLPIVEPERVSSPPLAITLGRRYRYSRQADDTVEGIRCYVVSFEPIGTSPAFRGRAWIAVDGFHMVRAAAAQTGLRGVIVSAEQIDDFREFVPGVWLLARSEVRQLYEGAAHRTPIHRVITIAGWEINPENFNARLQDAYRSPSVMLRETADGYRYLTREVAPSGTGAPAEVAVKEARADRVRTLAAGIIIDPNISVPLPFAGLNYVDFNLFGTGTQLNGFFGGSYAQLAVAVPSVRGSRWQLGGRAFGIASSYNDRSFREGRERFDENVRQRPAHAAVWLLRPLGSRLAIRGGYEVDYTRLRDAPETGAAFVVPADQLVHGARFALEGQRSGWAGSLWWNGARRSGWRSWGSQAADYDPSHRDFQRYGATIGRATTLTPAFVTRIEGAVMAGRDLDRFSRYSFGTFDNRLRGYPAALVRYDRGAVVRGALAWSASRFVRVDGFLDTAVVRDRGFGTGYRNYTGAGAAVEAPLPFGILAAVEWGYGIRGVNADGSSGTHVMRVSAFKIF
jgi:hypothetical protein